MKRILPILLLMSLTLLASNAQMDAPVANADAYATSQDLELEVKADNGVLSNDTANGAKLVFAGTSAKGGTITGADDGSFLYRPAEKFAGTDTFSYSLEGANGKVETLVTVTVYSALGGLGWVFMFLSIGGVWALAIFCYKKLLFDGD